MELPILYQKASNNKIKKWEIRVEENKIITKHGYIDGKVQETINIVNNGKNIGKKNETTKEEQAKSEAKSKWDKKKQEGYSEKMDKCETKIIYPMLALDYNKRYKDIKFPCYVQPKIDGCRAIYKDGEFSSRNGKKFQNLNHIQIDTEYILDGELYSETIPFEELVGIIKKEKVRDDDIDKINSLIFVVYDIVINDKTYNERLRILRDLKIYNKNVKELGVDEINESREIKELHDKYVERGYEGLMIRNKSGYYKEKYRSKDLQKYKIFVDREYEICGFKEGEGLERGCVIWKCKTDQGIQFNVRPKGTRESRIIQYKKGREYIGKKLTVKYQNLTEEGVPRFPVGVAIRDYE